MKSAPQLAAMCFLCCFSTTACNNPQKPSESNFKQAINKSISTEPICLEIGELPGDLPEDQVNGKYEKMGPEYKYLEGNGPRFLALENAGLLRSSPTTISSSDFSGEHSGPGRHFELTDEGKKLAAPIDNQSGYLKFCYAKKSVHSIDKWTEGLAGTAEVEYTYQLDDIAAWAKRSDIQRSFGIDKDPFSKAFDGSNPEKQRIKMQLTNRGWEVYPQ